MYLSILRKDLKRKKTMNMILLIFIILAVTFIASSISNMVAISKALNQYIDASEVADFGCFVSSKESKRTMEEFLKEEGITTYETCDFLLFSRQDVELNGKEISYSNTITVVDKKEATIQFFDENNQVIGRIPKKKIYLSPKFLREIKAKVGDTFTIHTKNQSYDYEIAGTAKDVIFGSSMVGMTRIIMNEADYKELAENGDLFQVREYAVTTKNVKEFEQKFSEAMISTLFNYDHAVIKNMFIMDMVTAGVLLLVSVCLIIISILVLKFTIGVTINEEFREIGVMKAIGIESGKIRGLYMTKSLFLSIIGGAMGFLLSIPFGKFMLQQTMENIVIINKNNILLHLICSIAVVAMVSFESLRATRRIKKMKPLEAIRSGATGERFRGKGKFQLKNVLVPPSTFLAMNDLSSKWRSFLILFFTFVVGMLLVIMPINVMNTLKSDDLVTWFSMTKSDLYLSKEQIFNNSSTKENIEEELNKMKQKLKENNIEAKLHQEIMFRFHASYKDNVCSSCAFQGVGDCSAKDYVYTKGSAPRKENEVAITHIVAERLKADIGDTIQIYNAKEKKEDIVTAIFQSMNNMGEGIRFCEKESLPYELAAGGFAVQLDFEEEMETKECKKKQEIIEELFPSYKVQSGGVYLDEMLGGISGMIASIKQLILVVVIFVNILVVVLIEKTLLTKEKGEIGLLRALGFKRSVLELWQVQRIGIVLLVATIVGVLLSTPFSKVTVGWIFQMMGAAYITFSVNPWEVYLFNPAVVLLSTILASFLITLGIKHISPLETSNIE